MSRILVIEDNAADIDLLKLALAHHGIHQEVVAIEDGEQAVRFLDDLQTEPDFALVIIDLNLPKYDGIEVLTRYRTHPRMRKVPLAVFTSSGSPAEKKRVLAMGVAAYLRKPMELDEFIALGAAFREMIEQAK